MQCKYCKTWRATGGAPSSQFLSNCHQCLVEIHCARACSNCTLYCIGRTMLRRVEACWSSKWPVTRRRQYITPLSKCLLCVVVVFALEWTHSTIQPNAVLIKINFTQYPCNWSAPHCPVEWKTVYLGKWGPYYTVVQLPRPLFHNCQLSKTKVELCTAAWSRRHQNGVKCPPCLRRNVERAVLRKGSSHFLTFIRLLGQRR